MPPIADGWMLAANRQGLVAVGPESEVEIAFDAIPSDLLALPRELDEGSATDGELVEELTRLGALSDRKPEDLPGHSLADALAGDGTGGDAELIWTAEEALVLPAGISRADRRETLRAFVAGLQPQARLASYAAQLNGEGSVKGDRPPGKALEDWLTTTGPPQKQILTAPLEGCHLPGQTSQNLSGFSQVAVGQIGTLDCSAVHRLGPIVRMSRTHSFASDGLADLHYAVAEIQEVDLRNPTSSTGRRVQGAGDREHCELIARAEGAERLAVRMRSDIASTSGVAAHTSVEIARDSALAELIERDAFMWTWCQQVSRERIRGESLPDDVRSWARALARKGWQAHWVNLTLESLPVVLCCLVHEEQGLQLGAACRTNAAAAVRRATIEAVALALKFDPSAYERPEPSEVDGPLGHLLLHRDPAMRQFNQVLYASPDEIDLSEVKGHHDPFEALEAIDIRPHFEELKSEGRPPNCDDCSARWQPFRVVRAVAEGLIPLTFGFGAEPVEVPLAGRPRKTARGDHVGSSFQGQELRPAVPHPFA